ncbi:hypothetical protein FRC02_000140 [Tulasnella sp. 418]|nr:hypothetical protein FRC02_000140 [Tulasnella sp. 418]
MESDYNDDYWERRYTLRDGSAVSGQQTGVPKARSEGGRLPGGACIPPILNVWKHKVLLAGKYLNVIRECGIDIPPAVVMDENVVMGDDKFYNAIEDAYTHANRTLLELLVKDQQLIPRLRSLRFYYFLTRSAFISAFFENARAELTKTAFRGASLSRLQSLFDLALVGSDDMNAAFRGDVRLSLAKVGLYDFLQKVLSVDGGLPGIGDAGALGQILNDDGVQSKGKQVRSKDKGEKDKDTPQVALDAITLDYTVKFPLSLVISRKTLLHYQFIFRFLFHIKSTEQALSDMWLDHKSRIWTTRTKHQGLEMWKLRVIVLRGRMMDFVTQLLAFVTGDILEMNWGRLETKLEAAETVDQILKDHTDFLQSCLKGCMLTDTKFLKTLQSLLHTCFRFTVYSQKLTKSLESTTNAVEKKDPALIDSHMKKQWDLLRKFEVNFSHMLRSLMDKVQFEAQNEPTMVPLFTRLTASQPRILPPL